MEAPLQAIWILFHLKMINKLRQIITLQEPQQALQFFHLALKHVKLLLLRAKETLTLRIIHYHPQKLQECTTWALLTCLRSRKLFIMGVCLAIIRPQMQLQKLSHPKDLFSKPLVISPVWSLKILIIMLFNQWREIQKQSRFSQP